MMMDTLFTQSQGASQRPSYRRSDVGAEALTVPAVHAPKLPSWPQALLLLGAVGFAVMAGKTLMNRPVKRKARR